MPLTVADLREKLMGLPGDAYVIVGGATVDTVEVQTGRVSAAGDYFGMRSFKARDDGKQKALLFTRPDECSDGEIVQRPL